MMLVLTKKKDLIKSIVILSIYLIYLSLHACFAAIFLSPNLVLANLIKIHFLQLRSWTWALFDRVSKSFYLSTLPLDFHTSTIITSQAQVRRS